MSKETKEEKIAIEEISNIAEEVKKICDQISKYDRNTINRILISKSYYTLINIFNI